MIHMQAASIAVLTSAVSGVDPAAEQAAQGQGIRINASQGLKGRDTLFTAILRQGIADGALPGAAAEGMLLADAAAETTEAAEEADKAEADALDVCSLLAQLMLMSGQPAAPVAAVVPGEAVESDEAVAPDESAALDATLPTAVGYGADGAVSPGEQVLKGTPPIIFDPAAGKTRETAAEVQAPPEAPAPTDKTGWPKSDDAGGVSVLRSIAAALENAVAGEVSESGIAADTGSLNTGAADGEGTPNAPVEAGRTGAGLKPADAGPERQDESGAESGLPAQTAAAQAGMGAGEVGGPPGEITAAVEKALARFVHEVRSFNGTARELKIVLEPESLGVLTISVVKTETGVSAKIKSEDKDVAAAISENLQKLIATMENRGIRLDDVDVSYARPDQNAGFGRQGFSRGGDGAPGGRYAPASGKDQEADAADDFWREYYAGTSGGDAAVDYRI